MLKTQYKANDVITLKLVSGEEIVGYFVSEDMGNIVLRKPVVPVPTAEGTMALAPYIMSSDYLRESVGEVPFNKQTIITTLETSKSFKDAYAKQVSGLDFSAESKPGLITS